MSKVALYNLEGQQVGEMELNDAVFGIEPNESVVHEAVVMQLASLRRGTVGVKNRAPVSYTHLDVYKRQDHPDRDREGSAFRYPRGRPHRRLRRCRRDRRLIVCLIKGA